MLGGFRSLAGKCNTPIGSGFVEPVAFDAAIGIDAESAVFDDVPMRRLLHCVFALLTAVLLVASAFGADAAVDDISVTAAGHRLAAIRSLLAAETGEPGTLDEADLRRLLDEVDGIGDAASALITALAPQLAGLTAQERALGAAAADEAAQDPAQAERRTELARHRAALEGDIRRASLLATESRQLQKEIAEQRGANLRARISQHDGTPLLPNFWHRCWIGLQADHSRLVGFRAEIARASAESLATGNFRFLLGCLLIGLAVVVLLRRYAHAWLFRLCTQRLPEGRLRRSALATASVALTTLGIGFGVQIAVTGLTWQRPGAGIESAIAATIVFAAFAGSFVFALGQVVLSPTRPSWRLLRLDDVLALRLRWMPAAFAVLIFAAVVIEGCANIAHLGYASTLLLHLLFTTLDLILIAFTLRAIGRPVDADRSVPAKTSLAARLMRVLAWFGVALSLAAVATGYIQFAHLLASQIVWFGIVAALAWLLICLSDDLFTTFLSPNARWMQHGTALEPRLVEQVAVVLSALIRTLIAVYALLLCLVPFGTEPREMLGRVLQSARQATVGELDLTLKTLSTALALVVIGLLVVVVFKRWFLLRLLPTTRMDAGMRHAMATVFGWFGTLLVFLLGLSTIGVSLRSIAWVASALSVGIGFGLRSIAQDFISGLMLLTEQPIRVGDRVLLDGQEGDVRRIRVRSSEIELVDRSTLIVPNSEFITKNVQNLSRSNDEARVVMLLPLPLDADVERVRAIIFEAIAGQPAILDKPAPAVLIEELRDNAIVFRVHLHISNPRRRLTTRSELLFDLLSRLRAEGIALVVPQALDLRAAADAAPTAEAVPTVR